MHLRTRHTLLPLLLALLGFTLPAGHCDTPADGAQKEFSGMSYLDNGTIRIGVDLDLGGAIGYLADSKQQISVVNNHDWGRQIQMSFYAFPVPFEPRGKKPTETWKGLGWNPIQSGDCFGNRAKVLAHTNDGKTMYTKCIPMQWPLNNEPGECTFETWITVEGAVAHVRSRLNNARTDTKQYRARSQELPAVYTNGPWYRLTTYDGDQPFTNAPVRRVIEKGATTGIFPWTSYQATENWSALLDDEDWGLGIWHEGAQHTIAGFAGKPGKGGTKDGPTGYISPLHADILDHNIQYEYQYDLILGTLTEIRRYVYDRAPRPTPPTWEFESDRRHWTYVNATDAGWPINGELHVIPGAADPQLIGPPGFWKAEDAPTLYVRAATNSQTPHGEVFWRASGQPGFPSEQSVQFDLVADGEYHTYAVDMTQSPAWKGIIMRLRLDPVSKGMPGEWVKIQSIGFEEPAEE